MAVASTHQGDLHVVGKLSCTTFDAPTNSITNDDVSDTTKIDATKLVHELNLQLTQADGSDVASETRLVHLCSADATIVAVEAVVTTAPTDDYNLSIDVEAGNQSTPFATVLSAPLAIDSAVAAREVVGGTISSASLADNDSLRIAVTAAGSSGTQAQGLLVRVKLRENAT
ncbi:hypothetical protein Pan216_30430 [Planctomycetes bacterium Pan216]|uniref:Uncharacterized protein n=1 Tax=Kolteria novifilia TaxID=2527975 RepID=A0A518B5E2_9BACT|nr:hypothetical protein Pan216_30430 [Planctomycetes bacterium Pan216]